jgi:hypothetical protein
MKPRKRRFKKGDTVMMEQFANITFSGEIGELVLKHHWLKPPVWRVKTSRGDVFLYESEFKLVPPEASQLLSL